MTRGRKWGRQSLGGGRSSAARCPSPTAILAAPSLPMGLSSAARTADSSSAVRANLEEAR